MKTVTTAVSVTSADSASSPFPSEPMLGGAAVKCAAGVLGQDVTLAPASSGVALPFPVGVSTAAVVVIVAAGVADLVVTFKGQAMSVPAGQPAFFYGVAAADLSLATVLGGSIQYTVGG